MAMRRIRRLDGAPELSAYDSAVAAMCEAASDDVEPPPTLSQVAGTAFAVHASEGADAVWITDEDDTVIAFATKDGASDATILHVAEDHSPRFVRAHVHFTSCAKAVSAVLPSWESRLESFNYEASGGVMNKNGTWSEEQLVAAAPVLMLGDSVNTARLSIRQIPGLLAPLVYAKCDSRSIVYFQTFGVETWPAADGLVFSANISLPDECLVLRACAALPTAASAGCGSHPERCAELERLPVITVELEREHPPVTLVTPVRALWSRSQLVITPVAMRCAAPAGLRTFVRAPDSGGLAPGAVLAYGSGTLHLSPLRDVGASSGVGATYDRLSVFTYCPASGSRRANMTVQVLNASALTPPPPPRPSLHVSTPPPSAALGVALPSRTRIPPGGGLAFERQAPGPGCASTVLRSRGCGGSVIARVTGYTLHPTVGTLALLGAGPFVLVLVLAFSATRLRSVRARLRLDDADEKRPLQQQHEARAERSSDDPTPV